MVKESAEGSSAVIRWDLSLICLVNLEFKSFLEEQKANSIQMQDECVVSIYLAHFSYVTVKQMVSARV